MNNFDKVWGACDARFDRLELQCVHGGLVAGFLRSKAEEHVCVACSVIQGLKLHKSKRKRHILLDRTRDVAVLGK